MSLQEVRGDSKLAIISLHYGDCMGLAVEFVDTFDAIDLCHEAARTRAAMIMRITLCASYNSASLECLVDPLVVQLCLGLWGLYIASVDKIMPEFQAFKTFLSTHCSMLLGH